MAKKMNKKSAKKKQVKVEKENKSKNKENTEKIKITYSKKALFSIIFLSIILIFLISLINHITNLERDKEFIVDENECVIQQITCCPCNMGGEERCMTNQEAEEIQRELDEKCDENIMCIALYNCYIRDCFLEDGECVEVFEERE